MALNDLKTMITMPGLLGGGGVGPQSWDFAIDEWPGSWSVTGNVLVPAPTAGSELVINGDMETNDPPDNWIAQNCTLSADADAHAGSQALNVLYVGAGARGYQPVTVVIGGFYLFSGWGKEIVGTAAIINLNGATGGNYFSSALTSSYTETRRVLRSRDTLIQIRGFSGDGAGVSANFDDQSMKLLSGLADTLGYTANAKATANVTQDAGFHGGVAQVSDADNFIYCFINANRNRLVIDKCVGGTCTPLVAEVVITYSDDAPITLERVGDGTYNAYYDGVKVVSAVSIADAVFSSAANWGPFATDASTTFSAFALDPV